MNPEPLRDLAEGLRCLRAAAAQGDEEAQERLSALGGETPEQ